MRGLLKGAGEPEDSTVSLTAHLHRQPVVLRLQQLVPQPRDGRRLQDVVQRRNVFVVGRHQNFQHVYFADVTVDAEGMRKKEYNTNT